jgi:hypothetical protein
LLEACLEGHLLLKLQLLARHLVVAEHMTEDPSDRRLLEFIE